MSEASVKFLREVTKYFENRPIHGEDAAYWANVSNAENCRKAADEMERLEQALKNIAEGNLGDDPWQANYERIRAVAAAALQSPTSPIGETK